MSALLKAGGVIRAVQLILAITILAFWIWLRSAGYTTVDTIDFEGDDGDKKTAGGFGAAAFALTLIAILATFAVSFHGLIYSIRSHYNEHATRYHMFRLCGDLFTWCLWLTANLVMRFTPDYVGVYDVVLDRWHGPSSWVIILLTGTAKVCLMIALFIGFILVIVELQKSRRHQMRGHGAPHLNKNNYMMVNDPHATAPMIVPTPPQPYYDGQYGHQSTAYA